MGDGSGAMATETERMSTRKFIVNGRRVAHRQGIAIVTVVACVRDVVITVVATGPSAHPTKAAALTVAAVCYILYAHHMKPPTSFAQVCCKNTTAKSLFIVSTLWHSVKIACSGGWLGGFLVNVQRTAVATASVVSGLAGIALVARVPFVCV